MPEDPRRCTSCSAKLLGFTSMLNSSGVIIATPPLLHRERMMMSVSQQSENVRICEIFFCGVCQPGFADEEG